MSENSYRSESSSSNVRPLPHVQPSPESRLKSARDLADDYGLSIRAIQDSLKIVFQAYPWLSLKVGVSAQTRYTVQAQRLLNEFRSSGLSAEAWINSVWATHQAELAQHHQGQPQPIIPEILPAEQVDISQLSDALRARLMSAGQLVQQQQEQGDLQQLNQQLILAMAQGNTERLADLRQYFQEQQQQRQTADAQWLQQLQQQGEDQAITEFLVTQQAKKAMLNRLEALDSLGNAIPHPAVAADG